ncbi:MAG: hypothetical protein EZS28_043212, partial [Streblomastix strix]
MFMCGSVTGVINDPIQARKTIHSADRFTDRGQLFIAQLKGHIAENQMASHESSIDIISQSNFRSITLEKGPKRKYTSGIMFMCGSVTGVINDPIQARKTIHSADRFTDRGQLFI